MPVPSAAKAAAKRILESVGLLDRALAFVGERNERRLQSLVKRFRPQFHGDGLTVWAREPAFLRDPAFLEAYRAGWNSGHRIGHGADLHVEWRVHILHWAARHALCLEGDFVECGVNTGIFSLALCRLLDFASLDRRFFLFDTFQGLPLEGLDAVERSEAERLNKLHYDECFETARANFAPYPNAQLVRGVIPESLGYVDIGKVAYLSIDMNSAKAETAAIEHFWPKLSTGAIVVLDDYGYVVGSPQMQAMDDFVRSKGAGIVAQLPTGQGIIVKPPA